MCHLKLYLQNKMQKNLLTLIVYKYKIFYFTIFFLYYPRNKKLSLRKINFNLKMDVNFEKI